MLTPLGWLYGGIADLRNALYDRGVFRSYSLGARTISIGNITTGGTGKTPLVAHVAAILAERGEKVCILTRGYGRENAWNRVLVSDGEHVLVDAFKGGDEPVELARILLGKAIVIADGDRVSAAKAAKEEFGVTAFVLDDGFQHRRAERDVDIVCIDATNPFGGGKVLPAGRLREPLHNLERADAVVITRADMVEEISDLKSEISNLNPAARIFTSSSKVSGLTEIGRFHSEKLDAANLRNGSRIAAFCGLGNPANFFAQVRRDFNVVFTQSFPDHNTYWQPDIDIFEAAAKKAGAQALLTTAKDAVKLGSISSTLPCFVVEIETVLDDEAAFRALL